MAIYAGPIGCFKGGTDFCPGPQDSFSDWVGEMAATNRVRLGVQNCCLKGNTSIKYIIKVY